MEQYPTYLIHYGIQGQKWGVRRFQNEDGTWTDDGLLRRKEQKHFVKEQNKINKKFDKVTSKINDRKLAGKKISKRQVDKAIELGTRHRSLDYISKNPRPYLNARGLNKASKARNIAGVTSGAAITGLGTAYAISESPYDPGAGAQGIKMAVSGANSIATSIALRKVEKMFLNNWMKRQYGDAIKESRNLTIKDLEAHGIDVNKTLKDIEDDNKKYRVFK